ncbi:MAG TPA: DUF4265 domain-containing protein [Planctomycetota bacterium]|nr:DUF4265 domain-containing protein [Planctomycetota bacterium]
MEHIALPVLDPGETKVVSREVLEVERLGDGGLRLLHSPAFIWGIAAGDVIDVDPSVLAGLRLRSRAGNVAVVVALADAAHKSAPPVRKLLGDVASMGGVLDGGPERMLVFTIPAKAGFGRIESAFDLLQKGLEGATWWYGNVYDRNDRPLGWWEERESSRSGR